SRPARTSSTSARPAASSPGRSRVPADAPAPMRPFLPLPLLLVALPAAAQHGVIRTYTRLFALTDARIESVTNGIIERGTDVIRDGVIEAVGADVQPPAGAEVIDATGLTLYPGFIDGGTR